MEIRVRRKIAVALLLLAAAPAAFAQSCNLVLNGELSMPPTRVGQPLLVHASIRGQPIPMALDTSSSVTTIDRATAEKFGLEMQTATKQGQGIGGKLRMLRVTVPDFMLGSQKISEMNVHVIEGLEADTRKIAVGLVGADVLGDYDLEFDVAHSRVALFAPAPCAKAAPWDPDAITVELFRSGGDRIRFEVKVDGKAIVAELDSGATRTLLTEKGARKLGVTKETPGVEPGGGIYGADGKKLISVTYRFQSFELGDEMIRNPRFVIADVVRQVRRFKSGAGVTSRADQEPDMYLGADWLRAHHVYVGRGASLMHFTYGGGTVFEK
jgi:predicted aspartyl protease